MAHIKGRARPGKRVKVKIGEFEANGGFQLLGRAAVLAFPADARQRRELGSPSHVTMDEVEREVLSFGESPVDSRMVRVILKPDAGGAARLGYVDDVDVGDGVGEAGDVAGA